MSKLAIVFPGQGSQYVGMAKSFIEDYSVARETFEEASEVLSFDMAALAVDGPEERLNETENTQPALLTASIAASRVLAQEFGSVPSLLSGHSLGEYTALVEAGAMNFSDGVRLVHLRGKFMQEAVPAGTGKMAAIIGLDLDVVEEGCNEASNETGVVVPANINSPGQIVISGEAGAVERGCAVLTEKGAKRAIELQVSAPSHSPLMAPAGERLLAELNGITIGDFKVPVVTNVEASPITDPERVRGLLVAQLVSPVRWVEIVEYMEGQGVTTLLEVGPGKVLTGLSKRITRSVKGLNLDSSDDLKKIEAALGSAPA